MRRCLFLVMTLLAIVTLPASASRADDSGAPPSFYDSGSHRKFSTNDDRRTLVITDDNGGFLGVSDPLFDGDGGRSGTITDIRLATPVEMRNFKRDGSEPYVVLRYSGGGLLVVSSSGPAAVRPRHCAGTKVEIIARNIACKIDLVEAARRYGRAENALFLTGGPSTIAPIDAADPCSAIVVHVEADGRTVSATDKTGRRLWIEDPFNRGGLEPYRYQRPVIWSVSFPATRPGTHCNARRPVAYLTYNSSQTGELNLRTGEFAFMGQD